MLTMASSNQCWHTINVDILIGVSPWLPNCIEKKMPVDKHPVFLLQEILLGHKLHLHKTHPRKVTWNPQNRWLLGSCSFKKNYWHLKFMLFLLNELKHIMFLFTSGVRFLQVFSHLRHSFPVNSNFPVAKLKRNTEMWSESCLHRKSNCFSHTVDGRNPAITSWGWWFISDYLQGFIHPWWCRISSINIFIYYEHFKFWKE